MAALLKEIFYFQIIKPKNTFSISIMSNGEFKLSETISGKKQENKKKISLVNRNTFFSDLEKLEFYSWPSNNDCGMCDDSSWLILADFEGKKRGVLGFLVLNQIPGLSFRFWLKDL